jgi:hypothetical protein
MQYWIDWFPPERRILPVVSGCHIQPHLQLIHRLPEILEPLEQINDSREGAIFAERPHAEDFGFGNLFNAPDAVLVHQQFEDLPGSALEAAHEVLVAV